MYRNIKLLPRTSIIINVFQNLIPQQKLEIKYEQHKKNKAFQSPTFNQQP